MTSFSEPVFEIEIIKNIASLSLFEVEVDRISPDSEKSPILATKAQSLLTNLMARLNFTTTLQSQNNDLATLCLASPVDEGANETKVKETLQHVYAESEENADAKALGFLFNEIEEAFEQKNIPFVDGLLAAFEPGRVKPLVSMGLLRGTFRARSLLKSWEPCLGKVEETLENNHEPVDKLLIGLRKKNG